MGDRSCRKSPGRFLSPMIRDPGFGQHARTARPAGILGRIVRSMSRTTNRTNPCAGTVPSIPARRSRKPHRLQCPARRSPRLRASSQRRCDGRGSRGLPPRPRKAAGAEDPGTDFPGSGFSLRNIFARSGCRSEAANTPLGSCGSFMAYRATVQVGVHSVTTMGSCRSTAVMPAVLPSASCRSRRYCSTACTVLRIHPAPGSMPMIFARFVGGVVLLLDR